MLAPIITNNLPQIKALCKTHFVKELYVFGSAVTNNFNETSDVDFLVEFKETAFTNYATNYFDMIEALERITLRRVDLLTTGMVKNELFKKNININKEVVFVS